LYDGNFFNIPCDCELVKKKPKIILEEDNEDEPMPTPALSVSQMEGLRILKAIHLDRKKDLTGDGCVESNPGPDSDEPA
jgi:hypothetical protein